MNSVSLTAADEDVHGEGGVHSQQVAPQVVGVCALRGVGQDVCSGGVGGGVVGGGLDRCAETKIRERLQTCAAQGRCANWGWGWGGSFAGGCTPAASMEPSMQMLSHSLSLKPLQL